MKVHGKAKRKNREYPNYCLKIWLLSTSSICYWSRKCSVACLEFFWYVSMGVWFMLLCYVVQRCYLIGFHIRRFFVQLMLSVYSSTISNNTDTYSLNTSYFNIYKRPDSWRRLGKQSACVSLKLNITLRFNMWGVYKYTNFKAQCT